MNYPEFKDLLGKTLTRVENRRDEELIFEVNDGSIYMLHHEPDCCESVVIEDICGNLDDLVGSEILLAEEATSDKRLDEQEYTELEKIQQVQDKLDGQQPRDDESFTWTFYRMRTVKGSVTIRWYGSSNGYYSERVDFAEIKPPKL